MGRDTCVCAVLLRYCVLANLSHASYASHAHIQANKIVLMSAVPEAPVKIASVCALLATLKRTVQEVSEKTNIAQQVSETSCTLPLVVRMPANRVARVRQPFLFRAFAKIDTRVFQLPPTYPFSHTSLSLSSYPSSLSPLRRARRAPRALVHIPCLHDTCLCNPWCAGCHGTGVHATFA